MGLKPVCIKMCHIDEPIYIFLSRYCLDESLPTISVQFYADSKSCLNLNAQYKYVAIDLIIESFSDAMSILNLL